MEVEFLITVVLLLATDAHSIEGADVLPWATQFNSIVELAFTASLNVTKSTTTSFDSAGLKPRLKH